jgi:HEAT repeat protein
VRLLRDENPSVVSTALSSLRRLKAAEAARAIVELLLECKDPSGAMEALAALRPADAGPALKAALRSEWACDRERAAVAIGRLEFKECLGDLRGLLSDPDSPVIAAAAEALGRMGDRDSVPDLEKALSTPAGSARARIVMVLASLGSLRGEEEALRLLRNGNEYSRALAAERAGILRLEAARPALRELLGDSDRSVVGQAIVALGSLGDRESILRIVPLLHVPPPGHIAAVVEALSPLGDGPWLAGVKKDLESRNDAVRQGAARILCSAGHREGAPELLAHADAGRDRLLELNGVRRPEVWGRLRASTVSRDRGLRRSDGIAQAAAAAGLSVEFPASPAFRDLLEEISDRVHPEDDARVSALSILEEVLGTQPLEVIVENDRLRILSRFKARAFWVSEFPK